MLDLKQIESFYPENLRIHKRNLLREYLQYVILDVVYSSRYGSRLVFMGGTAIHIIHGIRRFSEDLDFDNKGLSKDDFEGLSQNVLRKLKLYGYSVEIQNRYRGAFHCLVKFPGIFYQYDISSHPQEKLTIQIDSEPQNVDYKAERVFLNKFDIIGMSLYPEETNWISKVDDTYNNMLDLKSRYNSFRTRLLFYRR